MKTIFIILVFIVIIFYILRKHGHSKFWKMTREHPELAYKLFSESSSWYIDNGTGKPTDGNWSGPFYFNLPNLNRLIKIYGKVGEYQKSQDEMLVILEKEIYKNINTLVGINKENEKISINFTNHHFVLLVGKTGSGKSIFHNYLYKILCSQNSPEEIGFIFLDMTKVDFNGWNSKYIINNQSKMEDAIKVLEDLSLEATTNRHIFIHIEECDMFVNYQERTEKAISELLKNRKDITIIYSTSSPSERTVSHSMLSFVDIKVVFQLASQEDQDYILGEVIPMPSRFETIVYFDNKNNYMKPVDISDFESIANWRLN